MTIYSVDIVIGYLLGKS